MAVDGRTQRKRSRVEYTDLEDYEDTNSSDDVAMQSFCSCGERYNHGDWCIQCNVCSIWFHGRCVGIHDRRQQRLAQRKEIWICTKCRDEYETMPEVRILAAFRRALRSTA
eukprot:NODE_6386_length_456_cov_14.476658_g4858_i0.p4 GENE.NODE_6386_length_456_cov_14.476658_g4858_i0~~NODE_6386_length_456_cov_14.476658_g4858_i0.p4  ORF type:complete len:111 (+),score=25.34 NODE_6386_length_456_cov_14.476658_g4858_i0:65-397(+)